jgi:hypothetical protein
LDWESGVGSWDRSLEEWRVDNSVATTEAEESQLLGFVTRKRLAKIFQRNSHYWELLPINTSENRLRKQRGVICSLKIINSVTIICSYDL